MDLSDIGQCCQYPYCGIRDFLPFYCNSWQQSNDCKKCNQVPIKCMKCQLNFCLKHRYQESHDCISLQKPPVKSKTQRVVSKPPQVKKNPRNSLFHFPKFTVF